MAETRGVDDGAEAFDEGRYVFCAVRLDGAADGRESFEADGIEAESAHLVAEGDVGAVVQSVESVFDSDDPATVKRWLLDHQRVVDAAGDAFGTPLPFRFDTVLKGDDGAVRDWLARRRDDLATALASVAGRWEYRIGLTVEAPDDPGEWEDEDERLRALAEEIEDASEGAAFLKEKQYDARLREVRRARRNRRLDDLESRLGDLATEVRREESSGGSSAPGGGSADGPRLTVLAPAANEEAIGEVLEAVADADRVEIRFTGPWPPYSFAPALREGEAG